MLIVAFIIAIALPIVALFLIRTLDLYGTGRFSLVLFCFGWGLAAYGLAYFINTWSFYSLGIFPSSWTWITFSEFGAPVIEEILKGLILIFLVRRANFTYFVDGAIYGFAIGIGFAVIENFQYILTEGAYGGAFSVAFSRVLSTNLMHATATAMTGIAFGFGRFHKLPRAIGTILAGWLIAMLIHMGFNNLTQRVSSGLLLVYAAGIGIGGAGFIAYMIRRGISEGREWIRETLGEADRVTKGEKEVIDRLSDIYELLTPVRERFGDEKTRQVETFLKAQAQLGIKRKTLEKLTDEKMSAAVRTQMDEIRAEMDDARRAVGAYVMLYVRGIIPPETSPLWGALEQAIQERIANRPEQTGPSLWDKLGQRTAAAAASPANTPSESAEE